MSRHHVVVIGDAFVDIMASVDRLPRWGGDTEARSIQQMAGGSALNVAVRLGELIADNKASAKCSFFGLVGDDEFGLALRRRIEKACVADCMTNSRDHGTGVCIVMSGPDDRGFITQTGATGKLDASHLEGVHDIITSPDNDGVTIHISGYFSCHSLKSQVASFFKRARADAERCGKKLSISLDTNCDASGEWGGSEMAQVLAETDIFLPNEGEAMGVSNQKAKMEGAAEGAELEEACGVLARQVRGMCITTWGKNGSIMQTREGVQAGRPAVHFPAPKGVTPVDATGAGDAFDAGFLYKYGVCGSSAEEAIRFGSCTGALCTQSFGANDVPITAEGVARLLNDFD